MYSIDFTTGTEQNNQLSTHVASPTKSSALKLSLSIIVRRSSETSSSEIVNRKDSFHSGLDPFPACNTSILLECCTHKFEPKLTQFKFRVEVYLKAQCFSSLGSLQIKQHRGIF